MFGKGVVDINPLLLMGMPISLLACELPEISCLFLKYNRGICFRQTQGTKDKKEECENSLKVFCPCETLSAPTYDGSKDKLTTPP